MVLTFDIGGTSTKFAIIDENRNFVKKQSINYPNDELIDITDLSLLIIKIVKEYNSLYELSAICISTCGVVTSDASISGLSAIKNYQGFSWKDTLQEFKLPVYVENDANCSLLAEYNYGIGLSYSNLISLVLGTGIGGAVIIDGQILNGWAGEFGCMIDEITDKGIKTLSLTSSPRNTEIMLNKLSNQHKTLSDYTKDYDYNVKVKQIIDDMILTLAKNIINISFVTNPQIIIIGGGISENEWIINHLQTKIKEIMHTLGINQTWKIEAAHFKNDANLLGAYSLIKGGESHAN